MLLRAREKMFRLTRADFDEAGDLLRRAVALDPGYASAHGMLAHWYLTRLFQGWSDDWATDRAAVERAGDTALRLDPDHARTLALMGHSRAVMNRRFDEALPMLDRAFDRAPNDAEVLSWSVPSLAYSGRTKEAIQRAQKAIALSPHDPFRFRQEHYLSLAYYNNNEFDQSIYWAEKSLENNANYSANIRTIIVSLVAIDRIKEAEKYVIHLNKIDAKSFSIKNYQGPPYLDDEKRKDFLNRLSMAGVSF
jgi:tetratricopeptide (TPR) repeat protein